ncbi:myo-inosose-2 dehydratase [Pseudomonas putida]
MKAKLGIAPIAWWNDDLEELSDDVSLEECLRQASVAGFTGMETGRRFPMNMTELGPVLARHGISVCGGWFSGLLLDGDIEAEKDRISQQLAFFVAAKAPCLVYGETASSIQGVRGAPLVAKPKITETEMAIYGRKVSDFADWCARQGMPLAYHHHMGAVVETEPELDLMMKHSSVPLLFDAGHLAFAGGDVLRAIEHHHARIIHVHTKDIRRPVVDGLDRTRESFLDAVVKGAFTVPGDGSLDFEAIVKALAGKGYEGWFVVEAEQDPRLNPPLEMARKGHVELLRVMAAAGYQVV